MAKIKPLTGNHGDFSAIVLKAAASGNLAAVEHYLSVKPEWLHEVGPHGRTMLWEAAYKGRTELVAELIRRGADVGPLGSYYTPMLVELSALAVARLAGRDELAELLEAAGATDDIWAACHRGDLKAISRFLDADSAAANRPAREHDQPPPRMGWHPIHYAVAGGHLDAVKLLAERGASVGPHLELLVDWGERFPRIVAYVIKRAAEEGFTLTDPHAESDVPAIDRPDQQGFPPLIDACRGNHNAQDVPARVIELLVQGASIHVTDYKGKTALHRAGQAGFAQITTLLLDRGAMLELADEKGRTPIFDAIHYGRQAVVEILIRRGANLEHADSRGETPLFVAARQGEVEIATSLLAAGADRAHRNAKGKRAHEVVRTSGSRKARREAVVKLLKGQA